LDQGGWPIASLTLHYTLTTTPVVLAAVALAALVAVGTVRARVVSMVVMSGVVAGLAAVAVLVVARQLIGPPVGAAEAEQRLALVGLAAAATGLAATAALAFVRGSVGLATGLLAVPVAALVTAIGYVVWKTILGGDVTALFVSAVAGQRLGVGLVVLLGLAWTTVPAARSSARPTRMGTVLIAGSLALVLGAGVVMGRGLVAPQAGTETARIETMSGQLEAAAVIDYRDRVAPSFLVRRVGVDQAVEAIDPGHQLNRVQIATRLQSDAVEPLQRLLDQARAYVPPTPRVGAAHALLVASLQDSVSGYSLYRLRVLRNNQAAFQAGRQDLARAPAERHQWANAVVAL
jgi:hypothetical protein